MLFQESQGFAPPSPLCQIMATTSSLSHDQCQRHSLQQSFNKTFSTAELNTSQGKTLINDSFSQSVNQSRRNQLRRSSSQQTPNGQYKTSPFYIMQPYIHCTHHSPPPSKMGRRRERASPLSEGLTVSLEFPMGC